MTLPKGATLPTAHERQQIFFWLKRISSYTAWHRMVAYYQAWADVCEASVRTATDKGWGAKSGLPESDLILILKGLAHFEEGVRRLRLGDKRVFKYDANGEFVMAARMPLHWSQFLIRIDMGENGVDTDHTPYWHDQALVFDSFAHVLGESWQYIIEPQYTDDPAPVFYGEWLPPKLQAMTFPDPLPNIPDPRDNVLIQTGKDIPCSGIWEPIDAPVKKGFSLFIDDAKPGGPFTPAGCMAYLHGGSPAPNMPTYGERNGRPCTWRLLWRDDRYEDGTIPAEEASYVFQEPQAAAAEAAPAAQAATSSGTLVAETGQAVPCAGRW